MKYDDEPSRGGRGGATNSLARRGGKVDSDRPPVNHLARHSLDSIGRVSGIRISGGHDGVNRGCDVECEMVVVMKKITERWQ